MEKIIVTIGFTLFFVGLGVFSTESAFQLTLSLFLLSVGYAMMRWITLRYDFSAEDN